MTYKLNPELRKIQSPDNIIEVKLVECAPPDMNWAGEETVSFF